MKIEKTKRVLALAVLTALAACAPKGDELYARAEAALAKGDANAAVIDLKNLIQAEPQNAKARALLGKAFVATGQIGLAEVEIQKAMDLGAPAGQLLDSSCRVLLAKGEFEKILQDCAPEKGDAGQQDDLRYVNASALLALGRTEDSLAAFQQVVAAQPDDVEGWLGYASAASQGGGPAAFKSTIEKAPAAVKDDVRYWLAIGDIEASTGALAEAEAAFAKAVSATEAKKTGGPTRVMALGGLAEMQLRQDKIDEARKTGEKLAKAAPRNPTALMLRGQIEAASGNIDQARSLLEQAVKDMPNNANALILLSSVKIQQGQFDQAESDLKSVVAANPQNERAQQMLVALRARLGASPQDSLAGLQAALEQNPGDPTMLATAGRLSMEAGDRDKGLDYLAEAAKSSPKDDVQAQLNIANGYLVAGELDRALQVLEGVTATGPAAQVRDAILLTALVRKGDSERLMTESKAILARSGKDPSVRNMVGGAYAAAGKSDLAREQFNEALKLAPDDTSALMNLARLDQQAGKGDASEARLKQVLAKDPKNLAAALGLAAAANRRNDVAAAEKYLTQAAKDHPDSVEAQSALAQLYLREKQPGKAKEIVDKLVAAKPRDAQAANARGVVMVSTRDLPAAISSFEQARNLDPGSEQIAANLARAQALNKDTKGALATLDGALRDKPKSVSLLALASALSLQGKEIERATGYVERLRQAAPASPVSYQMEGDLAVAQKRYTDALAAYEKADPKLQSRPVTLARYTAAKNAKASQPEKVLEQWVAAHPNDAEVISVLAEGLREKGDTEGALRLYQQALTVAPESPTLNNNVAMVYLDKGDPRALAAAEKAYKALPNVPAVQDTYGWALFKAGKTDQAIKVLAEAVKGMPDSGEVQYHYAAALAKMGRNDEARAAAQKAVAGTMPPSLKADAERLLKELK